MSVSKSERFVGQVTSGRWILTVLAGLSFFSFTLALSYVVLKQRAEFKPETLVAMFSALLLVVQGVYKDYFTKGSDGDNVVGGNDDGKGGDKGNGGDVPLVK